MMELNYQKRKNVELFKNLENPNYLGLSNTQNYIPIYKRFFSLNETNYNSINLNHKWYIASIKENYAENENLLNCKIKHITNDTSKNADIFFKLAPLLDPFKYLIGKYDINDEKLFLLPSLNSDETDCNPKFVELNNSAYVDSFFLYLSSNLFYQHNFIHGINFYGSFLAIKNNFKLNIYDDLDFLISSDFFNKSKNILFKVDDYSHIFQNESDKKPPIKIDYSQSLKSNGSIPSIENDMFEEIFDDDNKFNEPDDKQMGNNLLELDDATLTTENLNFHDKENTTTIRSSSTCSSRTSHTCEDENSEESDCGECDKNENDKCHNEECDNENDNSSRGSHSESEGSYYTTDDEMSDDDFEEECIFATIPKFPVQVICMENCEDTFDNLILNKNLSHDEWFSALMQIIMILLTYQKAFSFTHNDLHTNNVMYNKTDKKFLYYCYNKTIYKVPTFGRIFKIIDFGRSIYKYDGKLFFSDSFKNGGDAATQYNTEPFFNDKKPRLEPNFSFDLCRLACSIFDYVIEDLSEIKNLDKCSPIQQIIFEWCLDDKGLNVLYKMNGDDRYPDFKLYKMIARCVHNHTPEAQLEREEFKKYIYLKTDIPKDIINIDTMPEYI